MGRERGSEAEGKLVEALGARGGGKRTAGEQFLRRRKGKLRQKGYTEVQNKITG